MAIAEGLAQRIVRGDVPSGLKETRIVALTWERWWPLPSTEASSRNV